MNLLDTASLVVTPNGYKASKLYSIIPSDGTGDMTFARTGDTATRVNSSGLIETVLANKPRLDYFNSTCPKLLLEPQRTNIVLQSNDLTTTWYNANASLLSNNIISPDGNQNADKILANTTNDFHVYQQTITVSSGIVYTMSLFVKSGEYTNIELSDSSSGKGNVFNLTNKTISNPQTGGVTSATSAKIEEYSNGWLKCSITYTTASTTAFFRISISNGTTTSFSGSASSGIYVYGAQLEAGAYATSYIPTTTASVTRNGDYAVTSLATTNANWTISCDFDFIPYEDIFNIYIETSTSRFVGLYSSFNYLRCVYNGGAGVAAGRVLADTARRAKVVLQNDGTNCIAFLNGVKLGSIGNASAVALTGASSILFTFYGGGSAVGSKSRVRSVTRHNTTLTDQECITLSSI